MGPWGSGKTLLFTVEIRKLVFCSLQIHTLSYEELQQRITELDPEMEREIEELRKRYQAKRQPIIDAIDAKKRRLQKY